MDDLKERILAIIRTPQLAGLATINDEGMPWVRYVMIVGSEDMTVRLATFINARKVGQIAANPDVHITCGVSSLTEMKPYVQIQGKAELVTTADEKQGFWNPGLANIFKGPDDPDYGVLIVKPYRIEYNIPGDMTPKIWTSE
jgi:general stress protein 26